MSKLPKYSTFDFDLTLPLSNKKIKYHAYTTAEERLLIAANASINDKPEEYVNNTLKVIESVITDSDGANIRNLPAIDIRYLLLHQRAKSVGEIIEFSYENSKMSLNIEDIKLVNTRSKEDYIYDIGSGFKVKMKELSFADEVKNSVIAQKLREYEEDTAEAMKIKADIFMEMIFDSIDSIFNEEDAWIVGSPELSKEDVKEWFDDVPGNYLKELFKFHQNPPYLEVTAYDEKGKTIKIDSRTTDFLSLPQIT